MTTQSKENMKREFKKALLKAILTIEFLWFVGIFIMVWMIRKAWCIPREFRVLYLIIIFCFIPIVFYNWMHKRQQK